MPLFMGYFVAHEMGHAKVYPCIPNLKFLDSPIPTFRNGLKFKNWAPIDSNHALFGVFCRPLNEPVAFLGGLTTAPFGMRKM